MGWSREAVGVYQMVFLLHDLVVFMAYPEENYTQTLQLCLGRWVVHMM